MKYQNKLKELGTVIDKLIEIGFHVDSYDMLKPKLFNIGDTTKRINVIFFEKYLSIYFNVDDRDDYYGLYYEKKFQFEYKTGWQDYFFSVINKIINQDYNF